MAGKTAADHPLRSLAGFTLVELLIVMGITSALLLLVTVNLIRPQTTASLSTTATALVADIKAQQAAAVSGDAGTGSAPVAHGLYLQATQYTLFKGAAYSAADADNYVVQPSSVTLSTTFPSGQIVFAERSGEILGWSATTSTITLTQVSSGSTLTVTVNPYGATVVANAGAPILATATAGLALPGGSPLAAPVPRRKDIGA
jgi:type II secretory pathway pseudopilin PulG